MSKEQGVGDEIISFPVPKRYLPAVVQALAKAMEVDAPQPTIQTHGASTEESDRPNEAALIDWTDVHSCKELRREIHHPGILALLDLTAEHPNELVPYKDVVAASGRAEDEVRAGLSALTKAIKRLYKVSKDQAKWPVEVHWAAGGEKRMYYLMRPEVARAWTQSAT